jgi:hypothetical protein
MLLETAIGGALGGVLRLAPEVLKLLDRKNERKHELDLLERNQASTERTEILKADSAQVTGAIAALAEGIKSQGQLTGVKWVDALNQSVRPVLTYGIVTPYVAGKFLVFVALLWTGSALDAAQVKVAIDATYTGADMGLLAGVVNFWFLGRCFDKRS